MNTNKIIYWISTVIVCGLMTFSASMYFTKTEMVRGFFTQLNYPEYLVIPLAIAKILGIVAILYRKNTWLKEWAYAGFFFDGMLASAAHLHAGDGGHLMAMALVVATLVSYFLEKRLEIV
jgi:DoxX-like family